VYVASVFNCQIHRAELREVQLPLAMVRALAAEAEASQMAKANIIVARGEKIAAGNLEAAARLMESASGSLHLRFLQTLRNVSKKRARTIVLPFPPQNFFRIFRAYSK
jgi:regulator of protease activity HflC (stomatin/prohibitin superfamily)